MYIAKFGLISMGGQVAKLTASHDFRSYVNNMTFLKATHETKLEIQKPKYAKPDGQKAANAKPKKMRDFR